MLRVIAPALVCVLLLAVPAEAARKAKATTDGEWRQGVVKRVIDGDTLEMADGQRVRLLDINTPELSHRGMPAEDLGPEAKARAAFYVQGKPVWLRLGPVAYDDYGRLLAHVIFARPGEPNAWLNGMLVREGFAHVYTFADNRVYPRELLALERVAETENRGIWALPHWDLRDADTCCDAADVGRLVRVTGVVKTVSRGEKFWYLGFGDDYRTDFTVEIPTRDLNKSFRKEGIRDLARAYKGRTLTVRGVAKPVNGTMVRVTHPEQIEEVK